MKYSVRTSSPSNAPSSANSVNIIKGSSYVKAPITSTFMSCFRGTGALSPQHRASTPIFYQSSTKENVHYYRKLSEMAEIANPEDDVPVHDTKKTSKQQRSHGSLMQLKEHKKASLSPSGSCSTSKFASMLWSPRKTGKVIQLSSPAPCASDHDDDQGSSARSRRRKNLRAKVQDAYEHVLEATRKGGPYMNDILMVGNHLFMPMSPAYSPASSPRVINRQTSRSSAHDYTYTSPSHHRHHGMTSPASSPFTRSGGLEAFTSASNHFSSHGKEEALMGSPATSSHVRQRGRAAHVMNSSANNVRHGSRSVADVKVY